MRNRLGRWVKYSAMSRVHKVRSATNKASMKYFCSAVLLLLIGPAAAHAQTLLGDSGGVRPALAVHGFTLAAADTENFLGNVSGGIKQGATLQGLTTVTLQDDISKLGLPAGTFNVSFLQLHGQSLSPYYLGSLQSASGTEGSDATRLWELWLDVPVGAVDVKLGQQSIDQEFIGSKYSGLFVNTMAGWPLVPSVDLYAGGPAYPLSAPGVRLMGKPAGAVTLLGGAFDDNPPGGAFANDPQSADAGGTRFNLGTGALFIAEAQWSAAPGGLAGTYKLGGWWDTGRFPDQAVDNTGVSLADPASSGVPRAHKGNVSGYAVVDQVLWQPVNSPRSLNGFARVMGAPGPQNLVSFSVNAGLTLAAPWAARANDTAGIDIGYGRLSGQAARLDRAVAVGAPGYPVRSGETLVEVTYQAQATPWLLVQPVAEAIFSPGGGVLNPANGVERLRDEFVAGVRATVTL
jgi:porin